MHFGASLSLGSTTWTAPSSAYRALIYPLDGTPTWIPSKTDFFTFALDAAGKLLVSVNTPENVAFNFAGQSFAAGASQVAIARYSAELAPESVITGGQCQTLVEGAETPLCFFARDSSAPLFVHYDAQGKPASSYQNPPFRPLVAAIKAGHLVMAAQNGKTVDFSGHPLQASYPQVALSFNPDSLELERAVGMDAQIGVGDGEVEIQDFVFADGGKSVVLAVNFIQGYEFGTVKTQFQYTTRGFALVKVKLYQ
jgi:hypothetical protein